MQQESARPHVPYFRVVVALAMTLGCSSRGSPDAADAAPPAPSDTASTDAEARPAGSDTSPPDMQGPTAPCGAEPCGSYAAERLTGRVAADGLNELSGLAASQRNPGVLYGHNDDDDRTVRVFALSHTGAGLGAFVMPMARARDTDTEDIAVGPCPAGSCVFLADAGDGGANQRVPVRAEYAILRFTEPDLSASGPAQAAREVPFERFVFAYPDGSHDSEAVLVDPASGVVYLVTKVRSGASAVYRLPLPLTTDALNRATRVADLRLVAAAAGDDLQVTGASAHPCGAAILLRTYSHVLELRRPTGMPFETVFAAAPARWASRTVGGAAEAITYRTDGRGYFTAAEGAGARIAEAACGAP